MSNYNFSALLSIFNTFLRVFLNMDLLWVQLNAWLSQHQVKMALWWWCSYWKDKGKNPMITKYKVMATCKYNFTAE